MLQVRVTQWQESQFICKPVAYGRRGAFLACLEQAFESRDKARVVYSCLEKETAE
ncbi:hypothetical protein [Brevibacillus laterosporus]|uniref:hypothetical protein n=1 Tax=Brevibacillus laterosporus TaxID=1465 RepID=UPI0015E24F7C|nr:hypothetical protein [Brevibacillus laterosporus]MED1665857.1 hypothetical protein [Brevibacillus laterosporus]MED1671211.1 hypothetical protein [Brevibacillus laterosporus]MED1717160.1 hypothetical protein [Brevibacillus laterosporus]